MLLSGCLRVSPCRTATSTAGGRSGGGGVRERCAFVWSSAHWRETPCLIRWVVDGDELPLLLRGVELDGVARFFVTDGKEDAGRITPHAGRTHETMLGAVPFDGLKPGNGRGGQKPHISIDLFVHSDPRHFTSA